MLLELQYAQLITTMMRTRQPITGDVPVTLEEIAGYLYCTVRNVKMLIRKMCDNGWIVWTPGRGRGNRSAIRFLASAEELLLIEAKRYVAHGNLNTALGLFQIEGLDPSVMDRFLEWLSDFFGYRSKNEADEADTLRLPVRSGIHTLDPVQIYFAIDLHLVKQVFDTLVRYHSDTGCLEPALAHYWEHDEKAMVWTFHLRKRVLFHHGRELTASDVSYSLLRLRSMGTEDSPNRWIGEAIRDVRVLDRLTVQVELEAPNYMFLYYMSSFPAAIVPEDIYSIRNDVHILPVGTGPFRVTRHDEGMLTLEVFEEYYREGSHMDRIELFFVEDDVRIRHQQEWRFHLLKSHHDEQPVPAHWRRTEVMTRGSSLLSFNLRKPGPQQDVKLRRAIHLAMDRNRMIAELGLDNAIPAEGFVPPNVPRQPKHDNQLILARELVLASGYRNEPLRILTRDTHRAEGDWIQERCSEIGIVVDIVEFSYEQGASIEFLQSGDAVLGGVVVDDDETRSLIQIYKMGNLLIRAYASDDLRNIFDERIKDIVAEPSPDVRLERIRDMERLLTDEYRVLFMAHTTQRTVFSPNLQGIVVNPIGWFDFKDIWFRSSPR